MRITSFTTLWRRPLLVGATVAIIAQSALLPTVSHAQSQPDWLVAVNNVRAAAGLSTVVADSASSAGAVNHARYVIRNNELRHDEVVGAPGYTPDGDAAGRHADISTFIAAPADTLNAFLNSAYHWESILDPGLKTVGYGTATYADVFPGQSPRGITQATVYVFNRPYAQPPSKPIMWPPEGGTLPYTQFNGGEGPDPLEACAGYSAPTGAALTVQLPSAPQVSAVRLTKTGVSGDLAACFLTSAAVPESVRGIFDYARAVVVFPRQPLSNGTYCVSVTNNNTPVNWSFTVGGAPVAAPAPCGSGSSPAPTPTPAPAPAGSRLTAGQGLNVGEQLLSPNGKTRLFMQPDGNLVLYRVDTGAALWSSGTYGKPMTKAFMQPDGNFVGYNGNQSVAYWSTVTFNNPGATLVLRDDGNLVILDASGVQRWASNTAWNVAAPTPTPTAAPVARMTAGQVLGVGQQLMSANGKVRLILQSDGNLVLYRVDNGVPLWASNTYGKAMTQAVMQSDGNFVGYNSDRSAAFWSSVTFNNPGASLVLRDDGNMLVVDSSGNQLWTTNTRVN